MSRARISGFGMPARRLGAAAVAVSLALAAAARGSRNSDTSSTTAATSASSGSSGGGQTVSLKETEFKFTPPSATVKPGQVTFDVSNDGSIPHSFTIQGPNGAQSLSSDLQPG